MEAQENRQRQAEGTGEPATHVSHPGTMRPQLALRPEAGLATDTDSLPGLQQSLVLPPG